jgi:prolyl-tRNA synthetase
MGCYGIGVSRTLAMIYENNIITKDGKFEGVALPVNIAPYPVCIIPKVDNAEKLTIANNIYDELLQNNIQVLFDDRLDVSIGAKIKDSKILGTPYTVVFGNSLDENKLEVENNKTGEKQLIDVNSFVTFVKNLK